jgi:CII-binding regulator of phage lambda lysogenization HflD
MQLTQAGSHATDGATASQFGNGFDGMIRDVTAIGSTTQVTGTIQLHYLQVTGRDASVQCLGTSAFTGTVNWDQLTISTPQVMFPCAAPYTNVTLSLVRQH